MSLLCFVYINTNFKQPHIFKQFCWNDIKTISKICLYQRVIRSRTSTNYRHNNNGITNMYTTCYINGKTNVKLNWKGIIWSLFEEKNNLARGDNLVYLLFDVHVNLEEAKSHTNYSMCFQIKKNSISSVYNKNRYIWFSSFKKSLNIPKRAIRSRKSQKDRQDNDPMK